MIVSGALFGLSAGILENYYACLMELVPYKKRTLFIGMQRLRPSNVNITLTRCQVLEPHWVFHASLALSSPGPSLMLLGGEYIDDSE